MTERKALFLAMTERKALFLAMTGRRERLPRFARNDGGLLAMTDG